MYYEITVEIHRNDEEEAFAVARSLMKEHAAPVTVTRVTPGRTFADGDEEVVLRTFDPN